MPSLAEALQKSHGRLLPLGWFYLLKALFMKRRAKMLDLLLVAVKPEYQNKGVNALLFSDLIPVYQKLGFIFAAVSYTHLDVYKRQFLVCTFSESGKWILSAFISSPWLKRSIKSLL